jgi:hypothetical protein
MVATASQIAEIYYRVKDAKMSGTFVNDWSLVTYELTIDNSAMPANFYSGSTSGIIVQRSYSRNTTPRENAEDEHEIWGTLASPSPPSGPIYTQLYEDLVHGSITGFTHYAERFLIDAPGYGPSLQVNGVSGAGLNPAAVELAFSGKVAYIDNAGNGNPFDPANVMYLGLRLIGYGSDGFVYDVSLDTIPYTATPGDGTYSLDTPLGSLIFRLPSGDLSCPLYTADLPSPPSGGDIIMTPTEWWPYAKGSPAAPVWDADSGALL